MDGAAQVWRSCAPSLLMMLVAGTARLHGHFHSWHLLIHAWGFDRARLPLRRPGSSHVDLVGDRALRVLVPARIAIIAGRKILAHLHNSEHAAHLDGTKWPGSGHHWQSI